MERHKQSLFMCIALLTGTVSPTNLVPTDLKALFEVCGMERFDILREGLSGCYHPQKIQLGFPSGNLVDLKAVKKEDLDSLDPGFRIPVYVDT